MSTINHAHHEANRVHRRLDQAAALGYRTVIELSPVPAGILASDIRTGECASAPAWGRALQLLLARLRRAGRDGGYMVMNAKEVA